MRIAIVVTVLFVSACARLDHVGKPPSFAPQDASREHLAMSVAGIPQRLEAVREVDRSSLWTGASNSLLGDKRAQKAGEILTVVIEIDEKAEISNSSDRSREANESLDIGAFFGLPERLKNRLPSDASAKEPVDISSSSSSEGNGSIKRNEKLTLRIAATITDQLPNGILRIEGSQEVRVNFELRELLVSGFVRPEDVSRSNEVQYDKIASARISYGGRGQITDVQQPRIGQQIVDMVLPY